MAKVELANGAIDENDLLWDQLKSFDTKITTSSLTFDLFLDGGFKAGVSRFAGEPSHGKTMQALQWASNWIDAYGDQGYVIYYDVEGRLSSTKLMQSPIFKHLKDNKRTQQFRVRRKNTYEVVAQEIVNMITNNPDDFKYFIVFDSLDMMKSQTAKALTENNKLGTIATVSNNLMRELGPTLCAYGHHFHILSQVRDNLGGSSYGPSTKMSGGWAIKHASDLIGTIQKLWTDLYIWEKPEAASIKDKGKRLGHLFTMQFSKTPNDRDQETVQIPIKRGAGIWKSREVADTLLMMNAVERKGSWVNFEESFLADIKSSCGIELPEKLQGFQKYYQIFEADNNIVDAIEKKLRHDILEAKTEVF